MAGQPTQVEVPPHQIEYPAIGLRLRVGPFAKQITGPFTHPSIAIRLLEYCSMDVVFVAIDFECCNTICGYPPNSTNTRGVRRNINNAQAGIAVLDTRELNESSENVVTARQFCVGPSWYCDTVPERLLFRTSETITLQELSTRLTDSLRFVDPTTNTLRPIVVIGHTLTPNSDRGDIACIEKLTDPSIRSPIIDYLDTHEHKGILTQLGKLLGVKVGYPSGWKSPSLREILEYLAIPFANLHVATNDAMFTLRATLMVAVREHQNTERDLTSTERNILSKLQEIALVPLSIPPRVKVKRDAFTVKHPVYRVARRFRLRKYRRETKEMHREQLKDAGLERMEFGDWANLDDFVLPEDIGIEQESSPLDGESLLDSESGQTPILPDSESLLDAQPGDESSDTDDSSGCIYLSNEETGEGKPGTQHSGLS